MSEIAIIIPSRLSAKRLPGKPLKLINGKEMILHVFNLAVKSGAGEVLVTTPDKKISDFAYENCIKGFEFILTMFLFLILFEFFLAVMTAIIFLLSIIFFRNSKKKI